MTSEPIDLETSRKDMDVWGIVDCEEHAALLSELERWRELGEKHRHFDGQCFCCGQYAEDLRSCGIPDEDIGCLDSCELAALLPQGEA